MTLISCTAISILSTDLYTPSMPHLPAALATTDSMVQLTLSFNFFAYAIAQLFHGPIADRFGARRLLLIGMSGVCCASLLCAMTNSINGLLAGRFIQGIFSSVPGVVVVILIRQSYKDTAAVKILGIHGMATGLAPTLGPMLGGYLFVLAGWRSSFWTIAAFSVLLVMMISTLLPVKNSAISTKSELKSPLRTYAALCSSPEFMRYTISLAAVFGALFAFVTAGPFIFLQRFNVPTESYGLYYGSVIAAFIFGNLITTSLVGRFNAKKLASTGVIVAVFGSLLLILLMSYFGEKKLVVMAGLACFASGLGVLMASGYTCLMDAAEESQAGIASAIAGSTQLLAAGISSGLVSYFNDGTAWPMGIVIVGFCVFAALIQFGLRGAITTKVSSTP